MKKQKSNERHGGFHALLVITGLLAAVAAEAQPGPPPHAPGPPHGRPGFLQPSRHVQQELVVGYANHRICRVMDRGQCREWDTVRLRSYNGGLVGPTIEARAGDTLHILLDNRLPRHEPAPPQPDVNVPHAFNMTNLHTHGLHVSPAGNSDNVLLALGPGQKFQFEISIPRDHPAGTFWYHPHNHGSASVQVGSGMAGALIIRGDIDEVPAIAAAREQIFLFQQIPYVLMEDPYMQGQQGYMVENFDLSFGGQHRWLDLGRRTTINGAVEPTLRMRPGEVQRWRFIHGGVQEPIRPRLVRESDFQAVVDQHLIAHDGITTGRIEPVQETELYPGYRADVMIRAGDKPDTYLLLDESFAAVNDERRILARVVVEGMRVKMALPTAQELAPLAPLPDITDAEVRHTRPMEFSLDLTTNPPRFLINGKEFDPNAPPLRLELGETEEWILTTRNRGGGHPFHIHVNPFQVLMPDGRKIWKDTIFVPPGGQEVRIRTRYQRYIGKFVMHCHFLDHEDLGMMQTVEVVVPGADIHNIGHGAGAQRTGRR